MPKRREGPVLSRGKKYYMFDEIIGFAPDKRRVRRSLRTQDPEKAQWLWEQEYKKQWRLYYGVEDKQKPKPVLFSTICREFIDYQRNIRHVQEWKAQESRLRVIYDCWGDIPIGDVSTNHLTRLDTYLKNMKRPRSNFTINHYFTLLKTLFNYAIKQEKYPGKNPINQVQPYTVDKKRRAYTPDEVVRIIAAAEKVEKSARSFAHFQKYAKRIVLMCLYTGMRLGEVLNLRWENIEDDKIVLKRSETKQRKEKVMPITAGLKEVLDSIRDNRRNDGYVFPFHRSGVRVQAGLLDSLLRRIREYSGVEDFIFHNLRHTASTIMASSLGQGVGLADVMKILGHSQIKTTMRYLHSDFDRMKKAMETLAEATKK